MKRLQWVSYGLLALCLAGMVAHWAIAPLPDWAVRTAGIGLMVGIFLLVFSTVRLKITK